MQVLPTVLQPGHLHLCRPGFREGPGSSRSPPRRVCPTVRRWSTRSDAACLSGAEAEGSRWGGWGCPQADVPGEKHLEAIPPLPALASGCRDVFSRVVSSWVFYTALRSPSCFRENTLALFYSVLYSNIYKFLQLAITVDFISPCPVVLGLITSELGQSPVGTWKLGSGA